MRLRYSETMATHQSLPNLWLLTDERNDEGLARSIAALPAGSAIVFRHYHLSPAQRIARFRAVRHLCRAKGHLIILADSALTAREWGADGIYGAARALYPARKGLLTIATAHTLREIGDAARMRADAVMLSPVFPTRSHPGEPVLGPLRFRGLALHAKMPVIALGGMTIQRARAMEWPRLAAIDGLS